MNDNFSGIIIPRHFIMLYLAIFSIGLFNLLNYPIKLLYSHLDISNLLAGSSEWVDLFDLTKPIALLEYSLSICIFILFYLFCIIIFHIKPTPEKIKLLLSNKKYIFIFFMTAIIVNIAISIFPKKIFSIVFPCWLLCLSSVPLLYLEKMILHFKLKNWFFIIMVLLSIIQLLFIFKPYIFDKMLIENDYFDIPEKTILSNGLIVDNTQYINDHQIGGLLKYDPRKDFGNTPLPRDNTSVHLTPSPLLTHFMNKISVRYKFTYHDEARSFAVNGQMTKAERNELANIYFDSPLDIKALNELYYRSSEWADFNQKRIYSHAENDFIKLNKIELANQAKAGWLLYHHNYIFGPINASALGAPRDELPFLYGWLNTISLMKIMQFTGGINYQTYFQTIFMAYPFYLLLTLLIIYLIFKDIKYVAISGLLLCISTLALSDQIIRLAPGLNPMRHIFDIMVFYCFYLFLTTNKMRYFIITIALSWLSILWSKDFGLLLLLSVIGTLFLKIIIEKSLKTYLTFFLLLTLFIGFVLYLIPLSGKNPAFIYMLLGISMPMTTHTIVFCTLFLLSILYLLSFVMFEKNLDIKYLYILCLFYLQLILIYFIWCPSFHHLYAASSTAIFLLITILHAEKKLNYFTVNRRQNTYALTTLSLLILYIPTAGYFYYNSKQYHDIFSTHITYHWPTEKTGFITTMEPSLLIQASNVIKQYEQRNKIYLISKYDTILPVLANKYNAFPYVELPLSLKTTNEIDIIYNQIIKDKPTYIFVDTDINRSFNGDIFHPNNKLAKHGNYQESFGRAVVLTNMVNIYNKLKTHYRPILTDNLITVYQKI